MLKVAADFFLTCCIVPHVDVRQLVKVGWHDVELDPVLESVEGGYVSQADGEHDVGEERGEVDHLAVGLDSVDEGEADEGPRKGQAADQLPANAAPMAPRVLRGRNKFKLELIFRSQT